ncbi:MAG: DUF1993 domain-containing protein [Xanthomonadales bacterium]|nr:hypothetical protein [Xanthomonadales bacterium]MCC6594159.1 DUF1993 domain-containing protein [Xanthomonadales bacterium]MCE7931872.1 DUF1993 domain-containing protein [Xanthomonadales bacterium PRO6]
MAIDLYEATIPLLMHHLSSLEKLLDKAVESAEKRGFEATNLLRARLAPDMFDFIRQVQIATDMAKGCGARLAGLPVPSFPDVETSVPELKARIAKTRDFLSTLERATIAGAEDRAIAVTIPGRTLEFTGKTYAQTWVWPNFYFHYTMAYALLRHNGVAVGKADFLGA